MTDETSPYVPAAALSDDSLVDALEARRLDPASFTHVEHVRAAWVYLRRGPLLVALARFTGALRAFAAHHGVAERYHATITGAYLVLIHEATLRLPADHSFAEFRGAHPELFAGGAALLGRYYRAETLQSAAARAALVIPDGEALTVTCLKRQVDDSAEPHPPGQMITIPGGPSAQPKSAQGSSTRHSQEGVSPQVAG